MEVSFKIDPKVAIDAMRCKRSKDNAKLRLAATQREDKLPKRSLIRQDSAHTETEPHSKRSTPIIVTYPVRGENKVDKIWYIEPNSMFNKGNKGVVWINKYQYFENVPPEVWHYAPGKYPVCQKWLKAREGNVLDHKSIQDFQRLVMLLSETIALMNNVDLQLK